MRVTIKLSLLEDYFRTQLHVLNYCVLMSSLSKNITCWLQMLSIAFLSYEQVIFMNYFNVINIQIQGYFC